jgi:gluconate 2-dehydrogenase gamma chain
VDYLAAATGDPHTDPGDVQLLLEGADDLDAAARERFGAAFAALPPDRQDDLLREGLADEDQAEFLALLLAFTLEALLCDPVYGGNPEGRGWSWLAIPAPTPRPPRPYALDAT